MIDPDERRLDAYRPGQPTEQFRDTGLVSGEPVLAGFALDLSELFSILDEE